MATRSSALHKGHATTEADPPLTPTGSDTRTHTLVNAHASVNTVRRVHVLDSVFLTVNSILLYVPWVKTRKKIGNLSVEFHPKAKSSFEDRDACSIDEPTSSISERC